MTTRIKLDPAAFGAGAPLYGVDPARVRVQFGSQDRDVNRNGAGLGILYADQQLNREVSRGSVTVTHNPIDVDDVQVDTWTQFYKNSMADLVQKAIIIVERPVGSALTAIQIRSL